MKYKKIERRKFTHDERQIVLNKTDCKCAHCGKKLDTATMTIDHVFPLNKGGLHDEYNMLPLCIDCNTVKGNYVYALSDYYTYLKPEYEELFKMYFTFASFEYCRQTIIGFDEVIFSYPSRVCHKLLMDMQRHKKSKKEIDKMYDKLSIKLRLRRAYPGEAPQIHKMIMKHIQNPLYTINETIYDNECAIIHAIEEGIVYTLETAANELCGVFMFERVANVVNDINILQLNNVLAETNLKLKFVMTYATVSDIAQPVFSNIMCYLSENQLMNGWLPLFFNLIDRIYKNKNQCFKIPYQLCGCDGTIEFMQIKEIMNNEMDYAVKIFEDNGYFNAPEYDMYQFCEYNVKYSYQYEIDAIPEAVEFFKKYPLLRLFFKPESYEFYDVGFVTH